MGTDITDGQPVYLNMKWLATHLHVLGPTGQGKSRLLLWLFELLCSTGRPIVLVDFKGGLYRMARDWAVSHGYTSRLELFDLSAHMLPGYNPLRENGLRIDLQAQWVREGVKSAWGASTFDATPQLARTLYLCLFVARALKLSLVQSLDILRPHPALREVALRQIQDPFVQGALLAFDRLNDRRKEELAASTLARLEAFCCDAIVRQVICSPQSLDLESALVERRILLINFAKYQPLLPDPLKLFARMIMSDLLAHVYKGHGEGKFDEHHPVYFMCDEVQNMATRQLSDALDEGRGIGLHTILAHQHLSQLALEDESGYLLKSVMNDARTKIIFGDLDPEDLEVLANNVMLDQYNPWALKDELRAPLFAPVETTRTSSSVSTSTARGRSLTLSMSESAGVSRATQQSRSTSTTRQTAVGRSHTAARGTSRGRTVGRGTSHTESDVWSTTDTEGSTWSNAESASEAYSDARAEVTVQVVKT